MKAAFSLIAAALTLTACSSATGPDQADATRREAAVRKALIEATGVPEPTKKLAAN